MAPQPGDPGFANYVFAKYGRTLQYGDEEYEAAETWRQARAKETIAAMHRDNRRSGFFDVCRIAWRSIVHMGMFADDPTTARRAMVLTAAEQINTQREISVRNRLSDQAREEERMRMLGRVMADEMMARVAEINGSRPPGGPS